MSEIQFQQFDINKNNYIDSKEFVKNIKQLFGFESNFRDYDIIFNIIFKLSDENKLFKRKDDKIDKKYKK